MNTLRIDMLGKLPKGRQSLRTTFLLGSVYFLTNVSCSSVIAKPDMEEQKKIATFSQNNCQENELQGASFTQCSSP